jgi:hypothetical protein
VKLFPLKSEWDKAAHSLLSYQYTTGIPSQSNKARERNKRDLIGRKKYDDMILYLKDTKDSTKTPRSNYHLWQSSKM